uniref:Putative pterin-4-alpha-carbinolamine dehydratase n=1 Tax=uncultured bacterium P11N2 TaxID=1748282 RepID=A0A0U3U9Q8_9BACT|nr:putative pterin-4-alpha-carbinolamine dehydratase [uncultured bacterium P11N2]
MDDTAVEQMLSTLDGWQRAEHDSQRITKAYRFKNYYETMAFVNAVAWIAHRQDHHPDLTVGYRECTVSYTTHSAGGLSEKDFACAAKLDALFAL